MEWLSKLQALSCAVSVFAFGENKLRH